MFDVWKRAIVLLAGLIICLEAARIRCFGSSLDQYEDFELSDIEELLDSQYFTKYAPNDMSIHGFKGNVTGRAITNLTLAFIRRGGTNVLALDWSEEASANPLLGDEGSYVATGVPQSRIVGHLLADGIAKITNIGFSLNLTAIYAHSLGAHLAGFAGRKLQTDYNLTIERIIGLDPSGPLFGSLLNTPLNREAGNFTVAIHTDPGGKGINGSYCHIDAWVNRGLFFLKNETERVQPDCPMGNFPTFSINGTCSHDLSWKLVNASLVPELSDSFLMSFANDYWEWARSNGTATPVTRLPENIDTTLRGNFYISTNGSWTYGLGVAGLRPVHEVNREDSQSSFSLIDLIF